jgi:hypothetical protein
MKAPDCPEHGNLVLDLARGRLDDQRAEEAETVRRDCAVCARWWDDTFVDEAVAVLDPVVAEVFKRFVPVRRRQYGWLAAAATVLLAVGLVTTSLLRNGAETAPAGLDSVSIPDPVLSTWDFEDVDFGTSAANGAEVSTLGEEVVFKNDLESGDLSSWSSHS